MEIQAPSENTLHFGSSTVDEDKPASTCLGLVSIDSNTLNIYFDADGSNTKIVNTISNNEHKSVVKEFVSLVTRTRPNTSDFTIVADLGNTSLTATEKMIGGKGISKITGIATT